MSSERSWHFFRSVGRKEDNPPQGRFGMLSFPSGFGYSGLWLLRTILTLAVLLLTQGCGSDAEELCHGTETEHALKYSFSYELLSRQDLPQPEFGDFRLMGESASLVTCGARLRITGDASGLLEMLRARFGKVKLRKYAGLISGAQNQKETAARTPGADRHTLNEIAYLRRITDLIQKNDFQGRTFQAEIPVVFKVSRATGKPVNIDFGSDLYQEVYHQMTSLETR